MFVKHLAFQRSEQKYEKTSKVNWLIPVMAVSANQVVVDLMTSQNKKLFFHVFMEFPSPSFASVELQKVFHDGNSSLLCLQVSVASCTCQISI